VTDARRVTGGPVALVILDGWGLAPAGPGNAVELARTPTFDDLWAKFPHTTMAASGLDVGLPDGQIGNSEVGHLNLGAGRVVYQDLTRIDRAIEDGSFAANPVLQDAVAAALERDSTLHIVGLVSKGGVHSSQRHIHELLQSAANAGVRRLRVHAITDGRDVMPDASLTDVPELEHFVETLPADARIATVIGRYWAMDRDKRWDRTRLAWDAFVHGRGNPALAASSAHQVVEESHAIHDTTDEFIQPVVLDPEGAIRDGDVVVLANFRPDRMRQLVHALIDENFEHFDRGERPAVDVFCMCEYDQTFGLPVLFPPSHVDQCLADVLEGHGLGQLHVAETEKYAHVTYFFDGGVERLREGEVRALAPSPRDVPTYDLTPEMNAAGVADAFVEGIGADGIEFAVVNFANPDMVGHTGVLDAAIEACEAVDEQLRRVVESVSARGGVCIITADHGNAEVMLTADGKPHTAHTTNRVPVIITTPEPGVVLREDIRLGDVAPTVLQLLGLPQPVQMTGTSIIQANVI
jgi:2,3-bisphosphoglycerate-independent phosphoglycerate mutase